VKVAEAELDDAFGCCESVQKGLEFRFLTELGFSKARIQQFSFSCEEIGEYSRSCLVQKFPYAIIYRYMGSKKEALIVTVSHLHSMPDYWLGRK